MSWTNELFRIYENNCGKEDPYVVLLPVSHSTANAQIEVTIGEDGNFIEADRVLDKKDAVTIIPVTEDSGSRSSGIAPHPLMDKLIYIGGDYSLYANGKKIDNSKYYEAYMEQLRLWAFSEYTHPAVKAVYQYLSKGSLLSDLIRQGVLVLDEESGKLKEKEKILGIAQEDCFVRFYIEYEEFGVRENRIWKDPSLQQSFIRFLAASAGEKQLCYATGKELPCTYKHPSKIRNAGDKAKLISSNDESGFSYRGRFDTKEQALSISYDFSQKLHNALKWLIEKQGIAVGPMTLVMWESSLRELPNLLAKPEEFTSSFSEDFPETFQEELLDTISEDEAYDDVNMDEGMDLQLLYEVVKAQEEGPDTVSGYRKWLYRVLRGYQENLDPSSKAMILIVDAATTGRLSISLYEEMLSSELFLSIRHWHESTAWHRYYWKEKQRRVGSFSLDEIAKYAFGTEQEETIVCKPEMKNATILRLLPCVIRGQALPVDITANLVKRASNPMAYKKLYNWERVLEAACGMIRKTRLEELRKRGKKEEFDVSLNRNRNDRDYLYGRLLAIAEAAEAVTFEKGESRPTNASRFFEAFSKRPYQTWAVLHNRLSPYLKRMKPGQRVYFTKLLCEVEALFDDQDYRKNTQLKPDYLLGYYCQLNEIYTKRNRTEEENNERIEK